LSQIHLKSRLVCLNLYHRVHLTPSSPDPKSLIWDIAELNPHQLALTMGTLGVGIMNSTVFLPSSESNSKIDGNQVTFGIVNFQPHPPTLDLVFVNLDQEMDLMIESFNFHVGSLGSIRLTDSINLGLSVENTAIAATSGTSVGSSSKVNLSVSIKLMKSK
jgi:hypothetical protein